jgi:hypothetical protein
MSELRDAAERSRLRAVAGRRRKGHLRATFNRPLRRHPEPAPADQVVLELRIRYAGPHDTPAIRRLAALDSANVPEPPVLLAEVDGELLAGMSLWDGRAIAHPFRKTQALVELLSFRARQIHTAASRPP